MGRFICYMTEQPSGPEFWVNVYPSSVRPDRVTYGLMAYSRRGSFALEKGRRPLYRIHVKLKHPRKGPNDGKA